MNDLQIRKAFHRTFLRTHHRDPSTLVLDELGLQHGKSRADIAVINGDLSGFEIKSDVDSLQRLTRQIERYSAVFDHATLVVVDRHLDDASGLLPDWWGVISVTKAPRSEVRFSALRPAEKNVKVDDYSVAQLLWRSEVQEILMNLGVTDRRLRERRARLYSLAVELLDSCELRHIVRECLKGRRAWRRPVPPSLRDD